MSINNCPLLALDDKKVMGLKRTVSAFHAIGIEERLEAYCFQCGEYRPNRPEQT